MAENLDKPTIEPDQGEGIARRGVLAQALARLEGLVRRFRSSDELVAEPLPDIAHTRPFPWEAHYPSRISWDQPLEALPLYALLDDAVATFGDRPCLDFLGRKSTYKEIGNLVDRAAKGFQELGVKKGVRVGLFLPNCPYYVVAFFRGPESRRHGGQFQSTLCRA